MTKGFDFRWGVPLLDNQPGYAKVYEFMLDHYATVITRAEFLCIVHLARYHYNSKRGKSRPSLDTITKEMGYGHKNSVSRLVQSLESKGMLKVTRRPGRTSIYDAKPFTQRIMALAGITTEGITLGCGGSITLECDGVSRPGVPEEEKDKETKEEEVRMPEPKSITEHFEDVMDHLRKHGRQKERIAWTAEFCALCFGGKPEYGRIGRIAKKHKHQYRRICQVALESVAKSPRGDPYSYLDACLKGGRDVKERQTLHSGRGPRHHVADQQEFEQARRDVQERNAADTGG